MNPIYQEILDARNGHYIHALEVSNVYELEAICESLFSEYIDKYGIEVLIDFCSTLEIYYFDDENENENDENEVYSFNVTEFLQNLV
jgi:hypothetical protein